MRWSHIKMVQAANASTSFDELRHFEFLIFIHESDTDAREFRHSIKRTSGRLFNRIIHTIQIHGVDKNA